MLVSFETAKLAKKKNFKEVCFAAYHMKADDSGYFESGIIDQSTYFSFPTMSNGDKIAVLQKDYIHTILRPTQEQLHAYLRNSYKLEVNISPNVLGYDIQLVERFPFKYIKIEGNNLFQTYEDALEEGLKQLLNKLPNV